MNASTMIDSLGGRARFVSILSLLLAACGSESDATPENEGSAATKDAGKQKHDGSATDSGGESPSASSNWPMMAGSPSSTYFNEVETKISVATAPSLQVAWTKDLGTNVNGAPIQVDGRIYATANTSGLFCFDAETGDELWHNAGPEANASSSPAYANGLVFIHGADAFLRAFDAMDGTLQWELDASVQEGGVGFSSPTIIGDRIVVGGSTLQEVVSAPPTFRGFVFAANMDGTEAWTEYTVPEGSTGASLWSSVSGSVEEKRVYAGTGNNYLEPATDTSDAILSLDLESGAIELKAQRWEGDIYSLAAIGLRNPDYDFGSNPILFEAPVNGEMTKLVAAGQKSGEMHVLRRDDLSEVAKRDLGPGNASGSQGIFINGAWDGTRLLFACSGATSDAPGGEPTAPGHLGNAVLFAIDPANGDIVWERQLPGLVMGTISVANGVGFVGADQTLEAFNTETGELLFKHTVVGTIASTPTISDGRVAFGSGIGWLFGTAGSTLTVLEVP